MNQYRAKVVAFGIKNNRDKSLEESAKDCLKLESDNASNYQQIPSPVSEVMLPCDFDFYDEENLIEIEKPSI